MAQSNPIQIVSKNKISYSWCQSCKSKGHLKSVILSQNVVSIEFGCSIKTFLYGWISIWKLHFIISGSNGFGCILKSKYYDWPNKNK